MLQRLYDIFFAFREYVVLALCVVFSLTFLALNDTPQIKRIRTISTVVFGSVQQTFSFISVYAGLKEENALLRRINVELADEATQLREARLENYRLRSLLGLKNRIPYRLISGEVVGKTLQFQRNTITLNVGRFDGVEPMMPVISDGGLVGLITDVTDRYAVVNILLNTDFRSSAKVQRSRVDGIVAWTGTTLQLKNISKTMDVAAGDVVLTSSYSNIFPEDVRIGVVTQANDQPGSLFQEVILDPGVDFSRLEEVFVLDHLGSQERTDIEAPDGR
jgi:rod shape-determining protein MreC